MRLALIVLVLFSSHMMLLFADPALLLQGTASPVLHMQQVLLRHVQLRTVHIDTDPAYHNGPMTYQAIPLAPLLQSVGIRETDSVQITSQDGFVSQFSGKELLQSTNTAQAFLAIESPDRPWPALATSSSATAGPFYLIWQHPKTTRIEQEKWPYQITRIEVKAPLSQRFPHILPDPILADTDPIRQGMQIFIQTCFACHTLNREGESHLGPDLNVPLSVTEYWTEPMLRRFIRDPQSVRSWSQGKMPPLDEKTLTPAQLDQLLAYLRHMVQRKK